MSNDLYNTSLNISIIKVTKSGKLKTGVNLKGSFISGLNC